MLALAAPLLVACPADEDVEFDCPANPGDTSINTAGCYCRLSEGAPPRHFVAGTASCGACDARPSENGDVLGSEIQFQTGVFTLAYCVCESGVLLSDARCEDCPSCSAAECNPDGCACPGLATCPSGTGCSPSGVCESCAFGCNSDCPCAANETCVDGVCYQLARCCDSEFGDDGGCYQSSGVSGDYCVAQASFPLGAPCTCGPYREGTICDWDKL
jgi:hypothetical protein